VGWDEEMFKPQKARQGEKPSPLQ